VLWQLFQNFKRRKKRLRGKKQKRKHRKMRLRERGKKKWIGWEISEINSSTSYRYWHHQALRP
jgi:hypothetical protein